MMHLSESIQALPYSFEPSVVSLFAYAVKSYPISSKYAHRLDIALALIREHRVPLASVSGDECSPITHPHGHHKMPKSDVPHEDDCMSQVIDRVCFSFSNVSHDRDELPEVQIDRSKRYVHHVVLLCIVVLGVFFTLKCWIVRFFPRFCTSQVNVVFF